MSSRRETFDLTFILTFRNDLTSDSAVRKTDRVNVDVDSSPADGLVETGDTVDSAIELNIVIGESALGEKTIDRSTRRRGRIEECNDNGAVNVGFSTVKMNREDKLLRILASTTDINLEPG